MVWGRSGAVVALICAIGVLLAWVADSGATAAADTAAPALTLPAAGTTNATSSRGAVVSFIAVATDDVQPTTLSCVPASGSQFAIGTSTVTCTAADAAGHSTTGSFSLTVLGAVAQLEQLRDAVNAAGSEQARQSGLLAQLEAARRAVDRDMHRQACQHLSVFADLLRDRGRNVDASDVTADLARRANEVSAALDCIASESKPVLLGPRADINATTAPSAATALIRFTGPSGSVSCVPTSPANVGVGTTRVTCTATNSAGSTTTSFLVIVDDREAPVLILPADMTVTAPPGSSSATVNYVVTATDNDGVPTFSCSPPSGSVFPAGTTTVSCTATDASGNTATGTFSVTVNFAISGRITDRVTGLPLSGVRTVIVDAVTRQQPGFATSGVDGSYSIQAPPGSYRVLFNGNNAVPYVREWWNRRTQFDMADIITMTGSVGGIDAALVPGQFVRGRVTDEVTGQGLAGVQVAAFDPAVPCCRLITVGNLTGATGDYQFVVPPGTTIKVQFVPTPGVQYMTEWWDNKRDFESANVLTVAGETSNINAALTPAVVIRGRVTDASGTTAVSGFQVSVLDASQPCCRDINGTQTDATGNYSVAVPTGKNVKVGFGVFSGPPPGTRYVSQWWNNKPTFELADAFVAASDVSGVDARLATGVVISGHVSDSTGSVSVGGVNVSARDATRPCCTGISGTVTDASGNYTLTVPVGSSVKVDFGPPPGSRYFRQWWNNKPTFEAADVIIASGDRSGIDARLASGVFIRGRVTDTTGTIAVAGLHVAAHDVTQPCCSGVAGTQTDVSGSYSLTVPIGTRLKLEFGAFSAPLPGTRYVGQWWNNKPTFEAADVLNATEDRAGIDARLASGFLIRGRVTDQHTGLPIPGTFAFAEDVTAPCCNSFVGAPTDQNGNYTIAVSAGTYRAGFNATSLGYIIQFWDNKPSREHADTLTVSADVSGIDGRLARGVSIRGRVTDATGTIPVGGLNVSAQNATLACCQFIAGTRTDALGQYTLLVPLGASLKIEFGVFGGSPPGTRYLGEWWNDKTTFETADPIIAGDDATGVDARLATGFVISGHVNDREGHSLPGIHVQVIDPAVACCPLRQVAHVQTNATGDYAVNVPAGTYKVQFFEDPLPAEPHMTQWWQQKQSDAEADLLVVASDRTGVDAFLDAAKFVRGRVTDATGAVGIPGAFVTGFNASMECCQFLGGSQTDALGNYSFIVPRNTLVKVRFEPPAGPRYAGEWWNDKSAFASADTLFMISDQVGIDARLAAGFVISGRVTEAETALGLQGIQVVASDATLPCCVDVVASQTGPTGEYQLLVGAGTYRVWFRDPNDRHLPQFWQDRAGPEQADNIVVGPDRPGVDASLVAAVTISGHVSDITGSIVISGLNVSAHDATMPCCRSVGGAQVDVDGNYRMLVPAGSTVKVEFGIFNPPPPTTHLAGQWWNNKPNFETADQIVANTNVSGIDARLTGLFTLSGRVTERGSGMPLAGIHVQPFDASSGCCPGSAFGPGTVTDQQGDYSLNLPGGRYRLNFFESPLGDHPHYFQWWSNKASEADADVLIIFADTVGANAELMPAVFISGRVTDASDGHPIQGLQVSAQDATLACCRFIDGAQTDASGSYRFIAPLGSSIKVEFGVFGGSPPGTHYLGEWWNDRPTFETATAILADANKTVDAQLASSSGSFIRGRVTDSASPSTGVANVGVMAQPHFGCCFHSTSTGPDGRYELAVTPGTYRISFFAPPGSDFLEQWWNGKPGFSAADLLTIPSSSVDLNAIDAVLIHGIPVRGRVTAPGGLVGVDRVGVVATLDDPAVPCCVNYSAQTDANGNYTMYVRAGMYRINFQPPNTTDYVVEYWDDQPDFSSATLLDVTGPTFNIDAELETGFRISGRVTDAVGGAGVQNAVVAFSSVPCCSAPGLQVTGPDGTYSFVLRQGNYKVGFFPPFGSDFVRQYWNGKPNFDAADVLVVDAARPNIDAVLVHGVRVSGRVTEAADPTKGIAGVNVSVGSAPTNVQVANAATMADGTYSFFVAPGDYFVAFSPPFGSDFILEFWNDKPDIPSADVLTVTGPTTGIDAGLARALTISGRVTDESGAPIPGIIVNVDRSELPFTFVMSAVTGPDGRYSARVPAGSYKVFFFPGAGVPFVGEWWRDKMTFETADVIDVSSPVASVDGVLARGVLISGRVTATGSGAGLAGASVYVYDATQPCCVLVAIHGTTVDGTYSITVSPGSYWVRFFSPGYAEQWWNGKANSATADVLSGTTDHLNIDAAMVSIGP